MTKINEVADALSTIEHELAPKWLQNDLIKKNLATSYDYWLEDTGIPITLKEYIIQYLGIAKYLGGIFSLDEENESCC